MSRPPARVRDAIEARIGAPLGAGTGRAGACRRCGMVVLVGLDAPRCAFLVAVDLAPVSADVELACLLTGRATFRLWPAAGRFEIQRRDQWNVRTRPDAGAGVVVVPEHRCGTPMPSVGWPATTRSAPVDPDADPPF